MNLLSKAQGSEEAGVRARLRKKERERGGMCREEIKLTPAMMPWPDTASSFFPCACRVPTAGLDPSWNQDETKKKFHHLPVYLCKKKCASVFFL